jgi:hypothetical protein
VKLQASCCFKTLLSPRQALPMQKIRVPHVWELEVCDACLQGAMCCAYSLDPRGPLHKVTQSPQARAEGSKAATRTTLCLALLALGRRFAMHARRALPPPLSCLGLPQCMQSRVFAWSFNTHASPRLPGSSFFPRHGLGQRPNCRPFYPPTTSSPPPLPRTQHKSNHAGVALAYHGHDGGHDGGDSSCGPHFQRLDDHRSAGHSHARLDRAAKK